MDDVERQKQEGRDGSPSLIKSPGILIQFQCGPVKENGVNGCQIDDILDILIARMQGFQKGDFSCRENAIVITKLQEAQMWANYRTQLREKQNVEGKDEQHTSE